MTPRGRVAGGVLATIVSLAACSSSDAVGTESTDPPASSSAPVDTGVVAETVETTPMPSDVADDDDQTDDDVSDEEAASDGGHDAVVTRSADAEGEGVQPDGPSTVTARITSVDGEVCDVCVWLADSTPERSTGLMGVTDLGDAVGMAFSWNAPTDGRFYMFDTPTPLSIAWFSESGAHVGQADMTPCLTDDSATCDRYGADAPYTLAIEMFEGQLGAVGITPGASVELLAGTESPTCVLAG